MRFVELPDWAAGAGRGRRAGKGAMIPARWLRREEKHASRNLPEHVLGDIHAGPFFTIVIQRRAHCRVETGN